MACGASRRCRPRGRRSADLGVIAIQEGAFEGEVAVAVLARCHRVRRGVLVERVCGEARVAITVYFPTSMILIYQRACSTGVAIWERIDRHEWEKNNRYGVQKMVRIAEGSGNAD